jgi:putative ABC transport system ATP-binding protein
MSLLSGGQRQAIATLMAFLSEPELLLLDEHTSALDPKTQAQLMRYSARMIQERRITCLMVTHDLEDALRYGNRLIMMHQGRIILDIANEEKRAFSAHRLLKLFYQERHHDAA